MNKKKQLDVTPEELVEIEAALQTQAKILTIQASAGGSAVRPRLAAVKQALAHIRQQTAEKPSVVHNRFCGWIGLSCAVD